MFDIDFYFHWKGSSLQVEILSVCSSVCLSSLLILFLFQTLSSFSDISVLTVAQIQKIKKNEAHFFRILLLGGPSPPSQLVPNPSNWSPNTFFADISVSVAQIKKIKKQGGFIFEFCFWEDPPHPVNWSPTHSTGPLICFLLIFFIGFPFVYH